MVYVMEFLTMVIMIIGVVLSLLYSCMDLMLMTIIVSTLSAMELYLVVLAISELQ